MEHVDIARIVVAAAPYSIDKLYDYLIPEPLSGKIRPGVRVTVPFGRGNNSSEGIVLAVGTGEKTKGLKPVFTVLDEEPVLDADGIALAFFLRQRCFCTMYEALKTILPTGLWYQLKEIYRLPDNAGDEAVREAFSAVRGGDEVYSALLAAGGSGDKTYLKDACLHDVGETLKALCSAKLLVAETEAQRRIHDRKKRMVDLNVDSQSALEEAARMERRAPLRSAALKMLAVSGRTSAADLTYYTGVSAAALRSLEKAGLVSFSEEEEMRVPATEDVTPGEPILLNEEQENAFRYIRELTGKNEAAAVLLHGVTGSGKTQIYIRLVQEVLQQGKTAMVLVPEIVLTPQIMRKFRAYFGDRVVMLHSELKLSERYDQW